MCFVVTEYFALVNRVTDASYVISTMYVITVYNRRGITQCHDWCYYT